MTVLEIVEAFERDMSTAATVALYDKLAVEVGHDKAGPIWSDACHTYDIKHADPGQVCDECTYLHDGEWTICRGCGFRKSPQTTH